MAATFLLEDTFDTNIFSFKISYFSRRISYSERSFNFIRLR